MVSFHHVSPPKHYINLLSPPYVLHAPPISFSIRSPEHYWVRSTDTSPTMFVPEKTRWRESSRISKFYQNLTRDRRKKFAFAEAGTTNKGDNLRGRFHTWNPWCSLFWLQRSLIFVYNTAQEQVVLIVKAWNSEYSDIPLDLIVYSEV